jgi:SPP1 gp7 family putative phage head morphogenesis protein
MPETVPVHRLRPDIYEGMEDQIVEMFREILFQPLVDVLKQETSGTVMVLENAPVDLVLKAIREGKLQYAQGVFSGTYTARLAVALRALGAEFDARSKVYRVSQGKVPGAIVAEASAYQDKAKRIHQAIDRTLNDIVTGLETKVAGKSLDASNVFVDIEDGFAPAAKALEVNPKLNPDKKTELERRYTDNVKLAVNDFTKKQVLMLHKEVEKNATEGYRFDKLTEAIRNRYGIAQRHAKFLARNETSIFMSTYREQRFQQAGVRRYIWVTSHDSRVRPAIGLTAREKQLAGNHRELDGHAFFFNDPPIVDKNTGRRANPGMDYNCRCIAKPILE